MAQHCSDSSLAVSQASFRFPQRRSYSVGAGGFEKEKKKKKKKKSLTERVRNCCVGAFPFSVAFCKCFFRAADAV